MKTFCVNIFVLKSISFQLLLRLMLSDLRPYFVSVLQNISVSISVSLFHLTKLCIFPFQFQFPLTNITLHTTELIFTPNTLNDVVSGKEVTFGVSMIIFPVRSLNFRKTAILVTDFDWTLFFCDRKPL